MLINNGFGWTFNAAADNYDKMRPGYIKELYNDIFTYHPIGPQSNVAEVGIGSGQATLPFLQTGCTLTAVECGSELAKLCRKKFATYPRFSVITQKFEDFFSPPNSVDLVYSATAFHWVPEEVGYPKVYDMLKPGGVFARFANHPFPCEVGTPLHKAIQDIYQTFRGESYQPLKRYTTLDAETLSSIASKYGFCDIKTYTYNRTRTFTAEEYISLLGTYSDNIAMSNTDRTRFFSKIEHAINLHGGTITIFDTLDLNLARKPNT